MMIEIKISINGTVLMAILVNMAIGEVNGINEHIFINKLSTVPLVIDNITTKNPATKSNVRGITEVLISSNLEAVEPIAPNMKA